MSGSSDVIKWFQSYSKKMKLIVKVSSSRLSMGRGVVGSAVLYTFLSIGALLKNAQALTAAPERVHTIPPCTVFVKIIVIEH